MGFCRGRRPRRPADLLKMPSYTVRAVEDAGPYEGVIGGLLHIGRRGEGGTFKDKMDAAAA